MRYYGRVTGESRRISALRATGRSREPLCTAESHASERFDANPAFYRLGTGVSVRMSWPGGRDSNPERGVFLTW